jgi:hypothetical protein
MDLAKGYNKVRYPGTTPYRSKYEIFNKFLKDLNPQYVFSGSARAFVQHVGTMHEQYGINHVDVFTKQLKGLSSLVYIEKALDKSYANLGPYKDTAVLDWYETMTLDKIVRKAVEAEKHTKQQTVAKYVWMFKQIYFAFDIFNDSTIQKHSDGLTKTDFISNFDLLRVISIPPKKVLVSDDNYRYTWDDDEDEYKVEYEVPGNLDRYTQCTIEDSVVKAVTNTTKYTEICYTVKYGPEHTYTFYRNCSNKRMSGFHFTFMDDIYSKTVFEALRKGTLPMFPSTITLDLVHFNVEEETAVIGPKTHQTVTLKCLTGV